VAAAEIDYPLHVRPLHVRPQREVVVRGLNNVNAEVMAPNLLSAELFQ